MIYLYFKMDNEVTYFCERLFRLKNDIDIRWKKDVRYHNRLELNMALTEQHDLIDTLTDVFMHCRLGELIRQLIEQDYFYERDDEIERIATLTDWIFSDTYYMNVVFGENVSLRDYVAMVFKKSISEQNAVIFFDSVVTFHLKPLRQKLLHIVGFAIDELKREEEHQQYIQSVRKFIEKKAPKMTVLHILIVEAAAYYYRESGQIFTPMELKKRMYEEPLYLIGLDNKDMILSPVITLSPKKIYIYDYHPYSTHTLTLMNVFQEKVNVLSKRDFPFIYQH